MRVDLEKPIKSFEDAQRFISRVLPGAKCRKKDGWLCQVVGTDGTVLGAARDWLEACRAACKPLLEAEHRKQVEEAEAKQRDAADFLMFLRKYLEKEFLAWKAERDAAEKAALEAEKAKIAARPTEAGDAPAIVPPSDP